uniref:HTH psq-type domain-containing protein n=1 Tax=Rhodnius prolixus TaxID=13249 RepID=T1HZ63_RHOPR
MVEPVKAVRKKEMGYKTAAKAFQVPRATLKDYVQSSLENQRIWVIEIFCRANACRILPDIRKKLL